MQTTVYFREEDEYLWRLLRREAQRRRTSVSNLVAEILEQYFEKNKGIGEILVDFGAISQRELAQVKKESEEQGICLEEVLKNWVGEEFLERARLVFLRVNK